MAGGEGGKLMAKVVKVVIGEAGALDCLHPAFLDIDTTEGCFACKDERLGRVTSLVESLQFGDYRTGQGNAVRTTVFRFCEECNALFEIDVPPLEVEDFTSAGPCSEGEEDNGIEKRRFAVLTGVEKASDFVVVENTIAPCTFF